MEGAFVVSALKRVSRTKFSSALCAPLMGGVVYEDLVPAFRKDDEEYMPVRAPVDYYDGELYVDFNEATKSEQELIKQIYVCEMFLREI